MVISIHRSELLSRHGAQGLPSAGRCRGVLLSDKAVSDGMHAGHISRRALGRDAEVSSDGKLFQEIKKQVGNQAAK